MKKFLLSLACLAGLTTSAVADNVANSLAELYAYDEGVAVLVNFPLTVTYFNSVSAKNTYVTDGTTAGLIYASLTPQYKAGDVIPGGEWAATWSNYSQGLIELVPTTPTQMPKVSGTATVTPTVIAASDVTVANQSKYVTVKNVVLDAATPNGSVANYTGTVGDVTITFRNTYKLAGVAAGTYNITGLISVYNGAPQFLPTALEVVSGGGTVTNPTASSIADLYEKSKKDGATVVTIDFPMTVTAANSGDSRYVFVSDGTSAGLIYASGMPAMVTCQEISKGWDATVKVYNGLTEIIPNTPAELPVAEKYNAVTYPDGTAADVKEDNIAKVLTFRNVVVAEATPDGKTGSFTASVGGTDVTFYNTFKLAAQEAGTYDIVGAISTHNALQVLPLSYNTPGTDTTPEVPGDGGGGGGGEGENAVGFKAPSFNYEGDVEMVDLINKDGSETSSDNKDESKSLVGKEFENGDIKLNFGHGTGQYYSGAYGAEVRLFAGETMTFTAINGATITKIFFQPAANSKGAPTPDQGEMEGGGTGVNDPCTWTGEVSGDLVFTAERQFKMRYAVVTYAASGTVTPTCATPVINPNGGYLISGHQEVAISCATEGASIYYSVIPADGASTNDDGTPYDGPFSVTQACLVKAWAKAEGYKDSKVAEAEFKVPAGVDNIEDFYATNTTEASKPDVYVFNNPVSVVYQSGNYLYLNDQTGWLLAFGKLDNTYKNGDVLNGIAGSNSYYNGAHQMTPVAATFGSATAGATIEPNVYQCEELATDMAHEYVQVPACTISKIVDGDKVSYTFSDETADVVLYDQFKLNIIPEEPEGQYTITGFVANYKGTLEVFPVTIWDSAVEGVNSDANVVSTVYFNLQGVRVNEPAKGQVAIRVATLSDGSVRASKVVVK